MPAKSVEAQFRRQVSVPQLISVSTSTPMARRPMTAGEFAMEMQRQTIVVFVAVTETRASTAEMLWIATVCVVALLLLTFAECATEECQ